jgi:hypothetical protein
MVNMNTPLPNVLRRERWGSSCPLLADDQHGRDARAYIAKNLHLPHSACASKLMIYRVHEMASPLRLVTDDYARAGCAYEEMAAG